MDNLIQVVNRLQGACTVLGDNAASDKSIPGLWSLLPTVVVIGGQSSGKSSVLEAVVGKDFLPRGTGIVTRRPLILQLVQTKPGSPEWGEFAHLPGRKLQSFDEMRQEIENETHRHLQRKNKPVSPDPIQLTVHSPSVPNLTLVDMPGLTKVPIDGQPKSIVQDLEDMARTYVKGENSIILAVSPANADLATSDALRLAREVDPSGERTIGVLTKLDIMDPGTDAREILQGTVVKLRHGWLGVVNRNQADINSKVSMQDARRKEMEFFHSTSAYKDLKNVGTNFLTNRVSDHLLKAIRTQMPVIQHHISKSVTELQKEIEALGGMFDGSRSGMIHAALTLCRQFETTYKKTLEGGRGGGQQVVTASETRLHDNISKLPFHKLLDPKYVKRVLEEADGYQPHLVAPEMGYRRLLEESIGLFKGPALTAVDEVFMVLRALVDNVAKSEDLRGLNKYSGLKREMLQSALKGLERMKTETRVLVDDMVSMECAYFTTSYFRGLFRPGGDPEALRNYKTLNGEDVVQNYEGLPPEEQYLRQIGTFVSGYLNMVGTQLKTTIPKAIVHKMVVQSKANLLEDFHTLIIKCDMSGLQKMLMEDEGLIKRREMLASRLALMNKAAAELGSANI